MVPICIILFAMPCLSCLLHCISTWSMFALLNLVVRFAKVCFMSLTVCARNLSGLYLFTRNSVWSVPYMYLDSFFVYFVIVTLLAVVNQPKIWFREEQ